MANSDKSSRTTSVNPLNNRYVSGGLAAFGVLAMAGAGFVSITTPGQQKCEADYAEFRVESAKELGAKKAELASATAHLQSSEKRVELLEEAASACREALDTLTKRVAEEGSP